MVNASVLIYGHKMWFVIDELQKTLKNDKMYNSDDVQKQKDLNSCFMGKLCKYNL